jgi:PAS domain S-box-containing protein
VVQALKEGAGFATAEYPGLDGRRVLGVGMQVPGLPLFVVEEVPLEQAYAPSRELTRRVIVALGGAMLLLLVMAVLLSRKITRPLEQLEQGTRRVGQGDLDFTIGRIPHLISDELDDLAQRFDAMVKALKRDRYSREQAEQKLRQLQSYLSNIINSMPSVLIGVDSALQVTQWNQEAEKISGVDANRAMGRPLAEVFPRMEASLDKVRRAIREHAPLLESKVDESRDGDVHYSDITIYPLVTDGVKGVVIRIDDVTDQVRIEEMMIQSEKMLTVAGLAAGMAHEINNPLAGILQNTQVIRNRMGLELERNREQARACGVSMEQVDCYLRKRDLPRLLSAVEESGQRAARIVTNMLSFSRNSSSAFVAVDLNELLEKSVELAASDYDLRTHYDIRQVVIRRDYAPDLPSVICDAGKIQQVFLNLLKNGAQAALEQADPPDDPHLTLRTRQEGEWVQVEIEDNGPGMPEAVRRHVFEPFFTTKKVGIGTGLGLSVSYFIIHENHGGTLMVESEPGRGSRFIVCLPLVGIGRP